MKTIAMLCAGALLSLTFATTITAQGVPAKDDSLRNLDGHWTPLPNSPKFRDAGDDLKTRAVYATGRESTHTL